MRARQSAQPLASLNTWVTMWLGKIFIRFLQSVKRGSSIRLTTEGLEARYTASISMQILSIPNCLATISPSFKAHSSTTVLDMFPSLRMKPATHSPSLHLRMPPPPAFSGLPNTDPSMLSFVHPSGGLSHLTWICVCLGLFGPLGTMA